MSRKNTWTNEEILLLKNNYPTRGINECLKLIKYPPSKIRRMAHKLNLKIHKDKKIKYNGKPNHLCNVNPDFFYDINKKEVSYFLGLMWSDGFLNKTKNCSSFGLKMVSADLDTLLPYLLEIGKWNIYHYTVSGYKETTTLTTNNKRIYDFLVDNDFDKKSIVSPNKILSRIPDDLRKYFFRGIIDGDGCFYLKKQNNTYLKQLTIASSYEQDWTYFEYLLQNMNIKYSIKKFKQVKSTYSILRITNTSGIKNIGNYVYDDFNTVPIGLKRKYDKFIDIISV